MKVSEGIRLIKPQIEIPWGIDQSSCKAMFGDFCLSKKTDGVYEVRCQWLSTEPEILTLMFNQNGLHTVELHRVPSKQVVKSFKRWQSFAESLLGEPTSKDLEYFEGPESSYWEKSGVHGYHRYYYKFGFVEKLGVVKT
ncbi:hypothetical protein [uncultured Pseudoteredinibacter sp.]|uniref:hypothetical protein n=1 Tax=uncultured Pseudoteredinibacter sp. TaxID=1641701 RepID=UPI0026330CE0|nr:hypothetical protein [uncultured Pseudoteredinibacter sp.]